MSEIEESRVRENLTHGIDEGTLVYNLSSTLHKRHPSFNTIHFLSKF